MSNTRNLCRLEFDVMLEVLLHDTAYEEAHAKIIQNEGKREPVNKNSNNGNNRKEIKPCNNNDEKKWQKTEKHEIDGCTSTVFFPFLCLSLTVAKVFFDVCKIYSFFLCASPRLNCTPCKLTSPIHFFSVIILMFMLTAMGNIWIFSMCALAWRSTVCLLFDLVVVFPFFVILYSTLGVLVVAMNRQSFLNIHSLSNRINFNPLPNMNMCLCFSFCHHWKVLAHFWPFVFHWIRIVTIAQSLVRRIQ